MCLQPQLTHNCTGPSLQSTPLLPSLQSSILHCLLGELEPLRGEVSIVGNLGYAAQEPWVYSGTLRENILFGRPYEEEWYYDVLQACSLDEDIDQFPHRDQTLVGERGVTLSGGQKARVTLARQESLLWVGGCGV